MEVSWDAKKCCHSGNCVNSLPEVFRIENGQFVIEPQHATESEVREVIRNCPANALSEI